MEDSIKEYGMEIKDGILILSVIGEIEGHDNAGKEGKTTKYEHMLPILAKAEKNSEVKGILFLVNTVGGDVSAGLALAEMISSMKTPTVSLVLGDSHSIGVPIAVATDYSFIVPTATMVIHPVRMSGTILGAKQTYRQFQSTQDRILSFIARNSTCSEKRLEEMMMETSMMAKDLGTVLVGEEAVKEGIINEVGGIARAYEKLEEMIVEK